MLGVPALLEIFTSTSFRSRQAGRGASPSQHHSRRGSAFPINPPPGLYLGKETKHNNREG